ncbi:MAG TPA: ABC transporter permease subunit, partial [Spirochaetota bacterium]|nr:ABC transporter permease subunit [Spirochaetota bacterium]
MKKLLLRKESFFVVFYFFLILFPVFILGADFFNVALFKKVFEDKTINILLNGFFQSSLSVILSLFVGIPIAFYISSKDDWVSKIASSTIFIPYFFPSVATGIAVSQLLKGTNLNYSLFSLVLAHFFYNSPIIIKYASESLKNLDKDLVDSAKLDGASRLTIFFFIIIPQIKDGLLRGVFLAFVYCFTSFAVVLSVGNIKFSTFETAIYSSMYGKFDVSEAFFYAIFQFFILSAINVLFFNREKDVVTKSYKISNENNVKVSNFFIVIVLIYVIFEYGIIANSVFNSIFNSFSGKIDISPFLRLFSAKFNALYPVISSIFNSLSLGFAVSLCSIILGVFALENRGKLTDFGILLSFGFSTAFFALSLFYLNVKFSIDLLILLGLGLSVISIPIVYSFLYDNYINFDKNLIKLSKIDGCNGLKTFLYVKFPIMRSSIITVFFQIFTIVYGEFTLVFSMKLQKTFETASVTNYLISSKRMTSEAAAFNTLNILIVIFIF